MKKIALGIGIALILLLTAIWVYLMFFSTTNGEGGTFGLFNFGDTTDTSVPISDVPLVTDDEPVVDVYSPESLRQLTTRPTIGHQEVFLTPSSTPIIYFTEAGTGHIYTIDTFSGEEERLSNITVPVASNAAISTNGMYAAIQSGEGTNSEVTLVTLPTASTSLKSSSLPDLTDNFSFTSEGTLLYSVKSTSETVAKQYDFTTQTTEILFTIPFREAVIVWGGERTSNHLVYPKATRRLQGFLYEANRSSFNRTPISGYGLSAVGSDEYIIYSKQESGVYQTYLYSRTEDRHTRLDDSFIPEKCVFDVAVDGLMHAVCANSTYGSNMPDEWLMGRASTEDKIYSVNIRSGATSLAVDTMTESGRELDVVNLVSINNGFIFKNRLDNTLWMYDTQN